MYGKSKLTFAVACCAMLLQGCDAMNDGLAGGPFQKKDNLSDTEVVAEAALTAGSYPEAARLYEKAAVERPNSATAFLGMGRAYIELGQLTRAEFALVRARDLDRRNPDVLNELGNLQLRRLHPSEAIELYDQALRLDRRNLSALTGRAVALDFLSRHADAQEVYRKALQYYPSNFVLLNNYALSQVLSGQIGSGLAMMQELVRDPDNGETVRGNMAVAYALDGRMNDARAMLEGTMSSSEIEEALARYAAMRKRFNEGEPIGYLVFG